LAGLTPVEMGAQPCHIPRMIYSVQIVENRVIETEGGESGMPAYLLERRFSTVPQAEEAGHSEAQRLRKDGVSCHYNILDASGGPVGPNGPV
jgi:hypothetical protein